MNIPLPHRFVTACLLLGLAAPLQAQDGPAQPIPDLRKGEELTRKNERWGGPIGVHFGYWRPRQRSNEQIWVRQLLVQKIEEGSPADGVLEVGDVILGADGTGAKQVPLFQGASKTLIPLANAITEAEARKSAQLQLLVWRKGKTSTVTLQLEYLGRYSDTAPYNCPKSQNVLRKGIAALAKQEKVDKSGLGILCLLASNDPTNPDNDKHQALAKKWAHELVLEGGPWHSGPQLIALAEYYMMTNDESIFPKLAAHAEKHATGVSWFGTTGHRWCEKHPNGSANGMIGGYGPINCSGTLGFLGLALAREAGVKSEMVEKSFKAQKTFFGHYAFKGGLPYGEHAYGILDGLGDYNGKCAMSAMALSLQEGEVKRTKFFASKSALSSDDVRGYAHGGPFFGQVFHPLGANLAGPKSANLQFREIQWHLDLKRRWNHTRIFDARSNNYADFSYWATAMLFYAAPLKQLVITGRDKNPAVELSHEEFRELVMAKEFDPKLATNEQLLAAIPSCQGFLRQGVANELTRRLKENPEDAGNPAVIDQLVATALDEQAPLLARVGSCGALMTIKKNCGEPVRSMKNTEVANAMVSLLQHETAYLRFAAVRVLERIDTATLQAHENAIMDAIVAIERPTFPLNEEDPLQWSHGIMSKLLVDHLLKTSLDGVDRAKLIPAVRSMLMTPSGHSRTSSTKILTKLNKEETMAVSDLLLDNIKTPPPADSMFGRGSGPACQGALANHGFQEGLILSTRHSPQEAIKKKVPQKYGKAALEMSSSREVMKAVGDLIYVKAVPAQEMLDAIMKGEAPKELPSLKRIDSIKAEDPKLKLPAAKTTLAAEATNFAISDPKATTYTWRKVYGAGKVTFTPNASPDSATTTVNFIDKQPGLYRFELAMTDSLGLSVVRELVTVTLHDSSGKLPANKPPTAKSLSLNAVPGVPTPIVLSGSDPDGDELGYVITELPSHGQLTDAKGRVVEAMRAFDAPLHYTADYGFNGNDQLTFVAMDGQGLTAKGTVSFTVSSQNVGVLVYEGFDYPAGAVHGQQGGSSFGFAGPWQTLKEETKVYTVDRGSSLSFPGMPTTGGMLTGGRHRNTSRTLDPALLSKHGLLKPGGELWFSVYIDGGSMKFGLKGGDAVIGFATDARQAKVLPMLNGKPAGEDRYGWSHSLNIRLPAEQPHMMVGHLHWGRTDDEPDTLKLYRVFNAPVFGPMMLDEPVGVLQETIAQEKLNSVFVEIFDTPRAIDEIRIGTSLSSVMIGTKPEK